jgi:hypothetical protein
MNPHLSSKVGRRSGWPSMFVVAALAVVGACDRTDYQTAPDDLAPQFAPGDPAPFTVVVKDLSGAAVKGAIVRVIDKQGNPYDLEAADPGPLGTYTDVIPTADYCASVRILPVSASLEPVIVPDQIPATLADDLVGLRPDLSPMLLTKTSSETWSSRGWADCLNKVPTKHTGVGTTIQVVMSPAAVFQVELVGPDGAPLFENTNIPAVVGWAVSPVNDRRPGFENIHEKLVDGFLQSVSMVESPTDPALLSFGLAPKQSFQIEFQQTALKNGRDLNFTATLKGSAKDPLVSGNAGTTTPLQQPLVAEPLYCNQTQTFFPQLVRFHSVNYGYMAEADIIPPFTTIENSDDQVTPEHLKVLLVPSGAAAGSPLNAVPMELVVGGADSYTVSFREDLPGGGRNSTDLSFTCTNAHCVETSQKTSGGSQQLVAAFFRPHDLSGFAKASLFLTGLTANHTSVTFSVKAVGTGESIPLADKGKGKTQAAFIQVPKPTSQCAVEDSNDDKIFAK